MKQWQMHSIAKHGRDTLKFAACSSDGSLLAVVFADVSIGFHFFFFFATQRPMGFSIPFDNYSPFSRTPSARN